MREANDEAIVNELSDVPCAKDSAATVSMYGSIIADILHDATSAFLVLRVETAPSRGKLYHGGKHLAPGDSVPADVGRAACSRLLSKVVVGSRTQPLLAGCSFAST